MRTSFLEKDKLYLNPHTGSVDTGDGWESDFAAFLSKPSEAWDMWGGSDLLEVTKRDDGEYEEVE